MKVFSEIGRGSMKGVTAERGNVFVKAWCGLKTIGRRPNHPLPTKCERRQRHPLLAAWAVPAQGGIFVERVQFLTCWTSWQRTPT